MFMTGIGSGLDFNAMIEVIVAAERAPKDNQLNRQEAMNEAEMDALKEIQNTINSFRDTVEDLNSATELNKLKSELSNSDVLGASVGAGAMAGEYNFNVTQLAQAGRDKLLTVEKDSLLSQGVIKYTTPKGEVTLDIAAEKQKLSQAQADKKDAYINDKLTDIANKNNIETDPAKNPNWKDEAKAKLAEDKDAQEAFDKGVAEFDKKIDRLNNHGMSIEEVQIALNNHENADGAKVSLVQTDGKVTMVLNAKDTGTANANQMLSVTGMTAVKLDDTGNVVMPPPTITDMGTSLQAAKDAKVVLGETDADGKPINGAIELTSATNKMENVLDGLTLTLKEPGKVTVKVARDEAGVKDTVKKFVDSYNKVMETVNTYTKSSEEQAAALSGDAGVRSMVSRLREVISAEYSASSLETLSQLGITTTVSGTLEIDQTKMDKALEDNFNEIANLFMGDPLDDSKPGMMTNMLTVLDDYHKNGGLFDVRQDRLDADNKRIIEEREQLDLRMEAKTVSLRDYYAKMDSQIAQMNQTQNMMISMLM
ncbi:flagellar hook-associated protein FliD [Photobacterium aquae]|uniref:Flagellar hook-associated protein 2 n=1 Tax=Photobacterium aquae TaxID=1195763 RepID=A0A0J1H4A9_9GAMM|nr:flagellar filament capping protein FliD [Photobacterium aquae]KLV06601.1 flagellar hook-associated protein FliD [Photobacterium aquae]